MMSTSNMIVAIDVLLKAFEAAEQFRQVIEIMKSEGREDLTDEEVASIVQGRKDARQELNTAIENNPAG